MAEKLDDPLINELLLVGAALGSTETITTEDGSLIERFIRGENCLEWLQDLQRALRRDDDYSRAIAVKLGTWKVVETKLIPLMLECRDDVELVVTLAKIFVMLTMPLHPTVKSWLLQEVDMKEDAAERADKIKRKAAARAQTQNLMAMKRAFVSAPEVVGVLVGLLEEPLSSEARRRGRTEEETLVIELVLTLVRNLLAIQDESGVCSGGVGVERVHRELLLILDHELALEVLLLLCQNLQGRDNASWNLLLMEMLFHLLRGHDAADVAALSTHFNKTGGASTQPAAQDSQQEQEEAPMQGQGQGPGEGSGTAGGSLRKDELSRAMLSQRSHVSRHNRFGTQLKLSDPTGLIRVVAKPCGPSSLLEALPQATRKRTRRNAVFLVGGGGSAGTLAGPGSSESRHDPLSLQTLQVLARLCENFLEGAYEPLIRSLKDEFRRDSSRLEGDDRILFFRITAFFLAFHRVVCSSGGRVPSSWVSSLVLSMDVLSFNLVLSAMDSFMAESLHTPLVHALALYKEMLTFLAHTLATSNDPALSHIATGLQHKLFYASEPVDKLSRMLSCWKPSLFPRSFLSDLLDLTHVQLQLLERNATLVQQAAEAEAQNEDLTKVSSSKKAIVDVSKGFDFPRYFAHLCTNQVVRMLTYLLEQYRSNSPSTNRRLLTFFQRMRNHDLNNTRPKNKKDVLDDEVELLAGSAGKATLEPMLFNVPLLLVLHKIIDDKITHSPSSPHHNLARFAKSVVRHLGDGVRDNPLLLVESLFQHPFPHHWCQHLLHAYVSAQHLTSIARAKHDDSADYEPGEDEGASGSESSSDEEGTQEAAEASAAAVKEGVTGARGGAPEKKRRKSKVKDKSKGPGPQRDRRRDGGSSSEEEEWDGMVTAVPPPRPDPSSDADSDSDASGGGKKKDKKQKKRKDKAKAPKRKAARTLRWDFDEDSALRRNYAIYKGTASCLEALARLPQLHKKGRSATMVKRRLQFLKIWEDPSKAKPAQDSEGEDNEEEEGPAKGKSNGQDSDASSNEGGSSDDQARTSKKPKATQGDSPGASQGTVDAASATQSSAAEKSPVPGTIDKKRRIRRQVESDSSSDESLDIV